MENRRILLTNLNSFDIVHEDSLLDMKILPSAVHNKFRSLSKNLPKHLVPSALRFWLLIDSNVDLERVLNEFKSRSHRVMKGKAAIVNYSAAAERVKQTTDDQWEKEDIDYIQGKIHFL